MKNKKVKELPQNTKIVLIIAFVLLMMLFMYLAFNLGRDFADLI